jgi:glycosyl transferase family 4
MLAANASPRDHRKTVLIVGPDFTPSSYPPALRIRFFAQHLREFGWEPIVIATDPRYYEWSVDPENEKLLPADLEIIRTRALPAKLTRKIGVGDLGIRSLWYVWRAVSELCRERKVDLIFIPVPPNPTMVLGRLAHARFGIPYVIDYIDPVVTDFYWKLPRSQRPPKYAIAYALTRLIEPFALKHVSQLVGVDMSYTACAFARYNWLAGVEATGIPYGGEPADFQYLRQHPRSNRVFDKNDALLHVSYVGRGGVDIMPALRAVFQAVNLGLQRTPEVFNRLRLHFVGTTYAHNSAGQYQMLLEARDAGIESLVGEHPGRVPYLDAIQILLDSHALLMLGSESAHYTASKVFPYILACKPLLAVFHEESSVVRILRETQAGRVVTFGNSRAVGEKTEEIATLFQQTLSLPRGFKPPTSWEAFTPYTARAMTSRLAEVFDKAIAS